ncbi:MAG TPA: hypothetical protein VMQ46_05775 [Acidimicrobiia bacterium]|nr:hypothetical protein [Acidimicrobiia bacterium]
MTPGEARMDFELDGISVEFGTEVERKLNEELVKGYPTEIIVLAREIALQDPDLIRTKVNLIPEFVQEISTRRRHWWPSPMSVSAMAPRPT